MGNVLCGTEMFCGFTKGMADDSVLLPPFIWAMRVDGKIPTRDTEGDNRLLPPPHMRTGLGATGGTGMEIGESGSAGAKEELPPLPPAPRTAPRGAGIREPNEPCDPLPARVAVDGIVGAESTFGMVGEDCGGGAHEAPVLAMLPFEDGGNQEPSGVAGAVPGV